MIHRMGVRRRFISRTSILLFFRKTHLSDTHMMTEILIAITALLIGAVAGFAVRNTQARREQQQACEKARQEGNVEGRAMAEHLAMEQTAQLKTALAAAEKEREMTLKHAEENAADMQQRMSQQQQEAEKTLESTKREAAEMLENAKREAMENLQRTRADYEKRMETAKAEHAAMLDTLKENYEKRAKETAEQQEKHHREQMEMLKSEMLAATQRVLEQRSEQLKQDNNEQFSHNRKELENILNPLNDNLRNMREQVEKARTEQIEKMATLDSTIRTTLQHADNVKASADKLANALTNENKAQGNFGEIRLKTLLENMGFTEGKEFEEQYLIRDETGKPVTHDETGQKLIPDTIIHFPEGRDIIIDSKMSLKAYADFANAGNEEERRAALKRHVESVRRHVDELSEKKYYQYITGKRESVDFVVMFIPYDNMLEHALGRPRTMAVCRTEERAHHRQSQPVYDAPHRSDELGPSTADAEHPANHTGGKRHCTACAGLLHQDAGRGGKVQKDAGGIRKTQRHHLTAGKRYHHLRKKTHQVRCQGGRGEHQDAQTPAFHGG